MLNLDNAQYNRRQKQIILLLVFVDKTVNSLIK